MKKATVDLFTRIFAVLAPPPNMTISQWADKYRRLSSESSAEPGRWRTSKAPYQREIMDAVCDMRIQKVVIMSAAQIGKTDALILNPIGYYMHYDPSPIMVMQPTIQMAETFSKDRLSPMLRDTPVLRDRVNDKSRNSGNTILQKIFPGGHVTMVGANSPSSLASRPIRILLADEIDRYPATAGNEGDPLLLAGKRLATFWNKKEVCVSTPTNKETSRIAVEFEHSTQEEWNVPCPACGAYTPLLWANIIFDRDKLDEIGCACPACGVVSSETEWKEQFGKGKRSYAATSGQEYTFSVTADEWRKLLNGSHTLTVTATDNYGGAATRTYTFSKNETEIELTLATPLEADDMVTKAIMSITRQIPAGAEFTVEACNNGHDDSPAWEDVTQAVTSGSKFFLSNDSKTAEEWGFNFRIKVKRNSASGDCFISSVGGNFE